MDKLEMKYFAERLEEAMGHMNLKEEKWVSSWEGLYTITAQGKLYSYHRLQRREIEGTVVDGLVKVCLYTHNRKEYYWLHRLVAQTFIPNPQNLRVVTHIGDRRDNRAANLMWARKAAQPPRPRRRKGTLASKEASRDE
jgi:hypothetical protein